jgi:hypothetical protein
VWVWTGDCDSPTCCDIGATITDLSSGPWTGEGYTPDLVGTQPIEVP